MDQLKETKVGLPNTCAKCGKKLTETAFALNDDQAKAGQIFCAQHAGKEDQRAKEEARQEAEEAKREAEQKEKQEVAARSKETERTAAEAKKTERQKGGRIT